MIPIDRIISDANVLNGQPCIRGTRFSVRRVLKIVAIYPNEAERMKEFPELDHEDIRQALHYAALQLPF